MSIVSSRFCRHILKGRNNKIITKYQILITTHPMSLEINMFPGISAVKQRFHSLLNVHMETKHCTHVSLDIVKPYNSLIYALRELYKSLLIRSRKNALPNK
ncbi:unnamed protein product [Schistosoma mansoni]|uniref:Smp_202330 n=1 Tax=Schistosoma mansoni TaxID=6183 RepID=UPI00022C86D6|nr:unnamed protein product [Schistosoma mansoni]|eukprot:XP_018645486.1 unnamed protein product [Schistosoma mansoni]